MAHSRCHKAFLQIKVYYQYNLFNYGKKDKNPVNPPILFHFLGQIAGELKGFYPVFDGIDSVFFFTGKIMGCFQINRFKPDGISRSCLGNKGQV